MRSLEGIIADNKLYGFIQSPEPKKTKVVCVPCGRRGAPGARPEAESPGWSPLTGLVKRNFNIQVETMRCDRCGEKLWPEEEKTR